MHTIQPAPDSETLEGQPHAPSLARLVSNVSIHTLTLLVLAPFGRDQISPSPTMSIHYHLPSAISSYPCLACYTSTEQLHPSLDSTAAREEARSQVEVLLSHPTQVLTTSPCHQRSASQPAIHTCSTLDCRIEDFLTESEERRLRSLTSSILVKFTAWNRLPFAGHA